MIVERIENYEEMEDIIKRYKKLYTAIVFDALDRLGYSNQAIANDIKPIHNDMQLAGPAFTIKGRASTRKDAENQKLKIGIINQMRYPCVTVLDAGCDTKVAHFGELTANSSKAHGAVGMLVDGGTRDSKYLVKMGYPTFCRYRNPVEAFSRYEYEYCQEPVKIRGALVDFITVSPGDFIFGDMDGAVIVPKDMILKVLELCENFFDLENKTRKEFKKGLDPVKVYEKFGRI